MPELPEVESVRQGLEQLIIGKTIERVKIDWERIIVTEDNIDHWIQSLCNQTIQAIHRRGKYLIFYLDDIILISHLRMEGKYHYYSYDDIPLKKDKHTHIRFFFTDGSQLHYHDVRKFGRMECLNKNQVDNYFIQRKLGPEPIAEQFNVEYFENQLKKVKKAIKPVLLEQKIVAGLGNIYADEVLFQAKIHPQRLAATLSHDEIYRLYDAILSIMAAAVKAGGSSVRTYLNSLGEAGTYQQQLKVYGRQEEPCFNCGYPISKIQFAGRGTHFCSHCQKGVETM